MIIVHISWVQRCKNVLYIFQMFFIFREMSFILIIPFVSYNVGLPYNTQLFLIDYPKFVFWKDPHISSHIFGLYTIVSAAKSNLVCIRSVFLTKVYFIKNYPRTIKNEGWLYFVNIWSINIYWSQYTVIQLRYNKFCNCWSNYLFDIADLIYLHFVLLVPVRSVFLKICQIFGL